MARPAPLPLAADQLPQSIRRFCDPAAPQAARLMAARGMVPVKADEQLMILLQLSADPDDALRAAAVDTMRSMPENVLFSACDTLTIDGFLDRLAELFPEADAVLERIVGNHRTSAGTVEWIALRCSEMVSERISVNEQRLLAAPKIIEALYRNKNTRMSTVDRLIDLAARNNVVLDIPTYQDHVDAIKGVVLPPPSPEPTPADVLFKEALAADSDDHEIMKPVEGEDAEEEVKDKFMPLMMRVRTMTSPQKMRLAMVGNATARALLVRDKNKTVSFAAISSPAMQESEVPPIARSKEVSEEILRYIGNKRDWTKNHEVKIGLLFNPKTPVGISLRFISHLRDDELKTLARSRNVAQPIKSAAMQRLAQKEKKEKGGK